VAVRQVEAAAVLVAIELSAMKAYKPEQRTRSLLVLVELARPVALTTTLTVPIQYLTPTPLQVVATAAVVLEVLTPEIQTLVALVAVVV
jgi:hypothetical protein